MELLFDALRDPWVWAYLGLLGAGQWTVGTAQRAVESKRTARRKAAGLEGGTLVDPAAQLEWFRTWASRRLTALLGIGILFPIAVVSIGKLVGYEDTDGLLLAFIVVIVFGLWNATDVTRSWLGGVAFTSLLAGRRSFQLGDRVVLKGYGGKVIEIDPWYVKLQTPDDDLVSIPTASLWHETLVSANAGDRASLVLIELRLAPEVDKESRRKAEGFLLDAIHASPYLDPSKPIEILVEQTGPAVVLRGKAYVGSTYHEFSMRSDVSKAFLDYAADEGIPLARR